MKKNVWIDTSFLYALFVQADENHGCAGLLWKTVIEKKVTCLTSNLITSELGTLLAYRFGHETAFTRLKMIFDSAIIKRVHSNEEIENKALAWWMKHNDQQFSVADCVSFECMKLFGIKKILTFDSDFTIAGYTVVCNAENL